MFDPEMYKEEDDELRERLSTSIGRFEHRLENFEESREKIGKSTILPKTTYAMWWFLHNGVAHPIIAVMPIKAAFDFHDYTSDKINGKR